MQELYQKLGALEAWKKNGEKKAGLETMKIMPQNIALRCKEITNFQIKTKLLKDQKMQAKQMEIVRKSTNCCYFYKRCTKLGILIPGSVIAGILILLIIIAVPVFTVDTSKP